MRKMTLKERFNKIIGLTLRDTFIIRKETEWSNDYQGKKRRYTIELTVIEGEAEHQCDIVVRWLIRLFNETCRELRNKNMKNESD